MEKKDRTSPDPERKRQNEHRAFFGRVSGKRLHKGQQALFDSLLVDLRVDLPEAGPVDLTGLFPGTPRQRIVEIGYGGGEHLAALASKNPENGFVGCEVFTGGIGKILQKIEQNKISNIRLFTQDAFRLLRALPDMSLDGVYLLYPDPWPKKRHHKRRFVSFITLNELARVIKPGGFFRFASDIEDYANWTLAHIARQKDFNWLAGSPGSWHAPFAFWQATRYEQKARQQGREKSFYFTFERIA